MSAITRIHAREILDSRGNPTVEVDIRLENGSVGRAAVPSGASTGSREAVELRDGDKSRYRGNGVQSAVAHVNEIITPALLNVDAAMQTEIDETLCRLDGTNNKGKLGANAILGVSLAVARASACSAGISLFRYLATMAHSEVDEFTLPVPFFNIINGGVHADNNLDIQEFMVAPVGANSFREALRMGAEIYHCLKSLLKQRGLSTGIGDEGGFAPELKSDSKAIECILSAIDSAGFRPGVDVVLAIDAAANEFYQNGKYVFKKSDGARRSASEMIALYENWIRQYPIVSLEDGLAEGDWDGWKTMTEQCGQSIQLVGDDIFVTNPAILRKAIELRVANAALIKVNQIGTLTETLETIKIAKEAHYRLMVSHRSGETTDDFIAHLAVATSALQIKSGAPCRGERLAKYNELLRIEEELGAGARYAGRDLNFAHKWKKIDVD